MSGATTAIMVVGLLSVLTNGILMVILCLDPLKKFRNLTNYFIISLTISDLLTGASGFAYSFEAPEPSSVLFGLLWATTLSSFITIFLMSCERFVVVLYPLRAKSVITMHRVHVSVVGNWIISGIIGGLFGHGLKRKHIYHLIFAVFTGVLAIVLVLICLYFVIIHNIIVKANLQREIMSSNRRQVIHQEHRLTGVLILLVVILLLTVVPYLCVSVVISAYHIFGSPSDIPKNVADFPKYFFPVELINFAVNPMIYAWRLPDYRRSLMYYFRKLPFLSKNIERHQEQKTHSILAVESNV